MDHHSASSCPAIRRDIRDASGRIRLDKTADASNAGVRSADKAAIRPDGANGLDPTYSAHADWPSSAKSGLKLLATEDAEE